MGGGDGICYRTARRAQKARVVLLKQVEKGEGRKEEGKKRGNYRNPRLACISRVYNVEPSEGSLIALYKNRGKD